MSDVFPDGLIYREHRRSGDVASMKVAAFAREMQDMGETELLTKTALRHMWSGFAFTTNDYNYTAEWS